MPLTEAICLLSTFNIPQARVKFPHSVYHQQCNARQISVDCVIYSWNSACPLIQKMNKKIQQERHKITAQETQ